MSFFATTGEIENYGEAVPSGQIRIKNCELEIKNYGEAVPSGKIRNIITALQMPISLMQSNTCSIISNF
jgi:hypothetical protein